MTLDTHEINIRRAFNSAQNVVTVARDRLGDGLDWSDIEPIKAAAITAITAVTGEYLAITGNPAAAKSAAVEAWTRLVEWAFPLMWDLLWSRLPALARWVPFLRATVGAFLEGRLIASGPELVEAAVSAAKAAGRVLKWRAV